MVESHVAASSIKLLQALEYGASEVAPYILGRNSVSFHPSGASVYAGSNGSKVCRFEISASVGAMLDLGENAPTYDQTAFVRTPALYGAKARRVKIREHVWSDEIHAPRVLRLQHVREITHTFSKRGVIQV